VSFLKELKGWLGLDIDSTTRPSEVSAANPLFVYIKLPCDIQPMERGEQFEDPLQEALEREELGNITGGGSQLSDEGAGAFIMFCGIDVDLFNAEKGLTLLRRELINLEAPSDTVLLYELDGHEYEEPIYRPTT
jgi:hypothetical protein